MRKIPEQCRNCLNMNLKDIICSNYEHLPGEYGREDVETCPAFLDRGNTDQLDMLVKYIDEDPDDLVNRSLETAINRILNGYEDKFKVMVIGVARRKIKSIVRMVDITDKLLDRLSNEEELQNMTASQSLRLLSELNYSINNDLSFIMKLIQPDSTFKDIQVYLDARQQTLYANGASPATESKAESIISNLSSTSREKIRDAFEMLLRNVEPEEPVPFSISEEVVEEVGDEIDKL